MVYEIFNFKYSTSFSSDEIKEREFKEVQHIVDSGGQLLDVKSTDNHLTIKCTVPRLFITRKTYERLQKEVQI